MNLFEINLAYQIAEDRLFATINEDGELDAEAFDAFQQIKEDRETVIEACILADKNDKAMLEALDKEIKNLQERKKSLNNKIEWREGYLTNVLAGEKFETARAKASFRKSERVVLDCEPAELPEIFQKVKIETTADKTAIKTELKAGREVTGAHLETALNIQIKCFSNTCASRTHSIWIIK